MERKSRSGASPAPEGPPDTGARGPESATDPHRRRNRAPLRRRWTEGQAGSAGRAGGGGRGHQGNGPAVRILVTGTFVLALAACGSGSAGPVCPGGATGSPSSSASPSSPPPRTPIAAFPLTVTRTGGIAGFHDTVVLQADGRLEVNSRGHTSSCRLKPEVLKDILRAVGGVAVGPPDPLPTARPKHPDDMVLLVRSDGRQGAGPAGRPVAWRGLQQQLSDPGRRLLGPEPGARAVRTRLSCCGRTARSRRQRRPRRAGAVVMSTAVSWWPARCRRRRS